MQDPCAQIEQELRLVLQEQNAVEEQIAAVQLQLDLDDTWLATHTPATKDYRKVLEEWRGLQAYLADLSAQATSLNETVRKLTLELEDCRQTTTLIS